MSSYIIVESNVLDSEKLKQYSQLAAPTVAKLGGEFLVKGEVLALQGESEFSKRAVIKFSNQLTAKQWYQSEEYQALIELRNQAMESRFHLVEAS